MAELVVNVLAPIVLGFAFVIGLIKLLDYWTWRGFERNPLWTCSVYECGCVLPADELVRHLRCEHGRFVDA